MNRKPHILGLVGLVIGGIGVCFQAFILKGDLDHRYPFKIMSVPPAEYYEAISWPIAIVGLAATFLLMIGVFRKIKRKYLAGAVGLVVCPIIFSIALFIITILGPYGSQLNEALNYDQSSATQRHMEFAWGAAGAIVLCLGVYAVAMALAALGLMAVRKRNVLP